MQRFDGAGFWFDQAEAEEVRFEPPVYTLVWFAAERKNSRMVNARFKLKNGDFHRATLMLRVPRVWAEESEGKQFYWMPMDDGSHAFMLRG